MLILAVAAVVKGVGFPVTEPLPWSILGEKWSPSCAVYYQRGREVEARSALLALGYQRCIFLQGCRHHCPFFHVPLMIPVDHIHPS